MPTSQMPQPPLPHRSGVTRILTILLAVVGSGLFLGLGSARAGLDDAAFRKAKAAATKLMKRPGEIVEKKGTITVLGQDDDPRSLEVLVTWAIASEGQMTGKLEPAAEKLRAVYEAYRQKVLSKHKGSESGWRDGEQKRVGKRRDAWREAADLVVTEQNVQAEIAKAVEGATSKESIAWIAAAGMPRLLAAGGLEVILEAGVKKLLAEPPSVSAEPMLAAVARSLTPQTRIRALDWVALELIPDAAVRIAPCLLARSVPVRRAAVRALRVLDDPRCVPSLIEALDSSTGLLASEIEDLLHFFTGQSFSASGAAWQRWFKEAGPEWLEREQDKRHKGRKTKGDVSFYGIPSPSDRIVFLLDRSGSMEHPAATQVEGEVTGGEKGSAVPQTKLQIAKAELRRAINRLGVDVAFNVLFYNHKVDAWQKPPTLVPATRENKDDARTWFMAQKPVGSTELFAGLSRALGYGDDLSEVPQTGANGVDTIFLLSDGAPTTGMPARLLTEDEIEAAVLSFLQANQHHRCIVHTIGVGPQHNKELMKRLAQETGGTYVAVAMD